MDEVHFYHNFYSNGNFNMWFCLKCHSLTNFFKKDNLKVPDMINVNEKNQIENTSPFLRNA